MSNFRNTSYSNNESNAINLGKEGNANNVSSVGNASNAIYLSKASNATNASNSNDSNNASNANNAGDAHSELKDAFSHFWRENCYGFAEFKCPQNLIFSVAKCTCETKANKPIM